MNLRTAWARRVLGLTAAVCAATLYGAPVAGAVSAAPLTAAAPCAANDTQCLEQQKKQEEEQKKEKEQENKREQGERTAESGQDQVADHSKEAEKGIGDAKDQVESCPPGSQECMGKVVGDGTQQYEDTAQGKGMGATQQKIDDFHPEPQNNADAAVDSTCDGFAADLPASALESSDPDESLTGVCEAMAQ
ncbi:hypothetical protein ACWGJ2_19995 [Streptomyces sp. NPDC054796]